MIINKLNDLPTEIVIFEPSARIKEALKKEEKPIPNLTQVRASLLYLLYEYRALGEFASEFAAEKLSYFLQRFGNKQLKLEFKKAFYGPYSGKVRHVLFALNGYYLKGYEQKEAKPFETLELMVSKRPEVLKWIEEKAAEEEKTRLAEVSALIKGFESPYGLELLASIDFLIDELKTFEFEAIKSALSNWSDRKNILFLDEHIDMAINHLKERSAKLYVH